MSEIRKSNLRPLSSQERAERQTEDEANIAVVAGDHPEVWTLAGDSLHGPVRGAQ